MVARVGRLFALLDVVASFLERLSLLLHQLFVFDTLALVLSVETLFACLVAAVEFGFACPPGLGILESELG